MLFRSHLHNLIGDDSIQHKYRPDPDEKRAYNLFWFYYNIYVTYIMSGSYVDDLILIWIMDPERDLCYFVDRNCFLDNGFLSDLQTKLC